MSEENFAVPDEYLVSVLEIGQTWSNTRPTTPPGLSSA